MTLQVGAVLIPARQAAGGFVDRNSVPTLSYAAMIAVVYGYRRSWARGSVPGKNSLDPLIGAVDTCRSPKIQPKSCRLRRAPAA